MLSRHPQIAVILQALLLWLFCSQPASPALAGSRLPSFDPDTQEYLCSQIRLQWRGLGDECLLGLSQLIQESALNPKACSSVGACGLGQFMPGTWREMMLALNEDPYAPRDSVHLGIEAFAYYQGRLDYMWRTGRAPLEAHEPGLASYNGGPGSIIKAQKRCHDARAWEDMQPCLIDVTGPANAKQTTDYVTRIFARWKVLEAMQ